MTLGSKSSEVVIFKSPSLRELREATFSLAKLREGNMQHTASSNCLGREFY